MQRVEELHGEGEVDNLEPIDHDPHVFVGFFATLLRKELTKLNFPGC